MDFASTKNKYRRIRKLLKSFKTEINEYIPNNPDKAWMKDVYSKAVKKSMEDDGNRGVFPVNMKIKRKENPLKAQIYRNKNSKYNFSMC